jgi:hypothetical protein
MSKVIRLPRALVIQAKELGEVSRRSPSQQIEYWVCLGKLAEDHPEFTPQMLLDTLNANSLRPVRH